MPNHITNILRFHGGSKRIDAMLEAIKNDEYGYGSIDFNKIIPMPPSLNIESGSRTNNAISVYLTAVNPATPDMGLKKMEAGSFSKLVNGLNAERGFAVYKPAMSKSEIAEQTKYQEMGDILENGRQAVDNYIQHGSIDWYSWSNKHWGTKWNAYDQYFDPGKKAITFHTAWLSPRPVLKALSEMYPKIELCCQWADEDFGSNTGRIVLKGGTVTDAFMPEALSTEAINLAAETLERSPESMGYRYSEEKGSYEYVEDEPELADFGGMEMG